MRERWMGDKQRKMKGKMIEDKQGEKRREKNSLKNNDVANSLVIRDDRYSGS